MSRMQSFTVIMQLLLQFQQVRWCCWFLCWIFKIFCVSLVYLHVLTMPKRSSSSSAMGRSSTTFCDGCQKPCKRIQAHLSHNPACSSIYASDSNHTWIVFHGWNRALHRQRSPRTSRDPSPITCRICKHEAVDKAATWSLRTSCWLPLSGWKQPIQRSSHATRKASNPPSSGSVIRQHGVTKDRLQIPVWGEGNRTRVPTRQKSKQFPPLQTTSMNAHPTPAPAGPKEATAFLSEVWNAMKCNWCFDCNQVAKGKAGLLPEIFLPHMNL